MEIQCKKRQLLRFAEVCVAVLILITLTQVCAGFYLVYASHFCMVGCCCLYFKFFSINFKIALEIKSCVILFFHSEGQTSSHWWHFKVQHNKGSTQRMQYDSFSVCCRIGKEEDRGTKKDGKKGKRTMNGWR